jgi:hypothetical protein
LLAVATVAAVMVGSGIGLERAVGIRQPAPGSPHSATTGGWFCPHGGGDGWRAWVAIANPNPEPVSIRITTFGRRGVRARLDDVVPGSTLVYRPVPARSGGEGTEVEYFGGWVGAGWVIQRSGEDSFLGGSRCADAPSPTWFLTDLPTARGQTARLELMNPFGEDATVGVVLRTDQRAAVRPGPLSPYVVPAGTSTEVRLNQFLLQAPGEKVVSAELEVQLGRVVAGAVTISGDGVATEVGEPREATRWSVPGAAFAGGSTLSLLNAKGRRSDISVIAQSASQQRVLSGVDGLSLSRGEATAFAIADETAAGLFVESMNKQPIAAGRRLFGTNAEPALVAGSPSPSARWLLLPTLPPRGGQATMVLQNPTREPVSVEIRLLGSSGSLFAANRTLTVPAGRAVTVDLAQMAGTVPVSALVTATTGTVVVGGASYGPGGAGYAATLAVPVNP